MKDGNGIKRNFICLVKCHEIYEMKIHIVLAQIP